MTLYSTPIFEIWYGRTPPSNERFLVSRNKREGLYGGRLHGRRSHFRSTRYPIVRSEGDESYIAFIHPDQLYSLQRLPKA